MAKKVEKYTAEITSAIVASYMLVRDGTPEARDAAIDEMAENPEYAKRGITVRSIRAKLSREVLPGTTEAVYIRKAAKSSVTGGDPAKKDEMSENVRGLSGLLLIGIEKANKTALVELIAHFQALFDDDAEAEAEADAQPDAETEGETQQEASE